MLKKSVKVGLIQRNNENKEKELKIQKLTKQEREELAKAQADKEAADLQQRKLIKRQKREQRRREEAEAEGIQQEDEIVVVPEAEPVVEESEVKLSKKERKQKEKQARKQESTSSGQDTPKYPEKTNAKQQQEQKQQQSKQVQQKQSQPIEQDQPVKINMKRPKISIIDEEQEEALEKIRQEEKRAAKLKAELAQQKLEEEQAKARKAQQNSDGDDDDNNDNGSDDELDSDLEELMRVKKQMQKGGDDDDDDDDEDEDNDEDEESENAAIDFDDDDDNDSEPEVVVVVPTKKQKKNEDVDEKIKKKSKASSEPPAKESSKSSSKKGSSTQQVKSSSQVKRISSKIPLKHLAICIPDSIISIPQSSELRSYFISELARTAAIFSVDEIIILKDNSYIAKSQNFHQGPYIARNLQYLETPQYLRKLLFPIHPDLKNAGLMNPIECHHHLKSDQFCTFREGVVMNRPIKEGEGSWVEIGLKKQAKIPYVLAPNTRVTLKIKEPTIEIEEKNYTAEVVSQKAPKEEEGLFWGYQVRLADDLNQVLKGENEVKYDIKVLINQGDHEQLTEESILDSVNYDFKDKSLLVVFSGYNNLQSIIDSDEYSKLSGKDALGKFDAQFTMQKGAYGVKQLRLEEEMAQALSILRRQFS